MAKAKQADVPPVGYWLSTQVNDRNPRRAEAARHITDRWDLRSVTSLARILRTLAGENSEHLSALREMLDDYAAIFGLDEDARFQQTGIAGTLVPVEVETCRHELRNGAVCGKDAIPGTGLCGRHGGSWVTEEERANLSIEIQDRILTITGRAVSTLAYLMDHAGSEMVRMQSAVAILDRAGLGPTQKVDLNITGSAEQMAEEVRERLRELAATTFGPGAPVASTLVVEGEVEEDPLAEPVTAP